MELIKELDKIGENGTFWFDDLTDEINITFEDFIGFDENYNEIDNENFDNEIYDKVMKILKDNCIKEEKDLYLYYEFEDCDVCVGFTSFDI